MIRSGAGLSMEPTTKNPADLNFAVWTGTISQQWKITSNAKPRGAYNGTVSQIPGTIQAEHFDVSGNNSAYFDDSPGNTGGALFRTDEDVDIENCTDVGGGYSIGYATAGEWMEYTVNVAATGNYKLDLRVACFGDGRTVSFNLDGKALTNNIAIPNTGGWQTWATTTVNNVPLTAGQHVLRLTIGATTYVNINSMTFSSVVTGIENYEQGTSNEQVSVFPNPFEGSFRLNYTQKYNYRIFDLSGQQLLQGEGQGETVLGEMLQTGCYILQLQSEDQTRSMKISKK